MNRTQLEILLESKRKNLISKFGLFAIYPNVDDYTNITIYFCDKKKKLDFMNCLSIQEIQNL